MMKSGLEPKEQTVPRALNEQVPVLTEQDVIQRMVPGPGLPVPRAEENRSAAARTQESAHTVEILAQGCAAQPDSCESQLAEPLPAEQLE